MTSRISAGWPADIRHPDRGFRRQFSCFDNVFFKNRLVKYRTHLGIPGSFRRHRVLRHWGYCCQHRYRWAARYLTWVVQIYSCINLWCLVQLWVQHPYNLCTSFLSSFCWSVDPKVSPTYRLRNRKVVFLLFWGMSGLPTICQDISRNRKTIVYLMSYSKKTYL